MRFSVTSLLLSYSICTASVFASSGGWTGGGGDGVVLEFVSNFYQVNRLIESMAIEKQREILGSLTVKQLFAKIRAAEITSEPAVIWEGVEKDAINFVKPAKIIISRSRWPHLGATEKAMLAFHEVMGLLNLDRGYEFSQLLNPILAQHGIKKVLPYSWDCAIQNEAPGEAFWLRDGFWDSNKFLPRVLIFNITGNSESVGTAEIQIVKANGQQPDFPMVERPIMATRTEYDNETANGPIMEGEYFGVSFFDSSGSGPWHQSYGFTTMTSGDPSRAGLEILYRKDPNGRPAVWTSRMVCKKIEFLR
jgi:hypothetical protein